MRTLRLPPHRLDLTMPHWLGAAAALLHHDDRRARSALERAWAPDGDGLAFLSVRSAFDCALSALDWPPGSEVLVSAVNIREMVGLLQAHGLVAVPLPLEPRTMQPLPGSLRRAVTPRTRGLLLAHLFGARADVAPLFAEARALGLICFEDAAQAFRGPDDRGDPLADLSFFSFGTIKTATALGGALVRIGRPELRQRMAAIQASWPRQERRVYARKVGVALVLLALQVSLVYTAFCALCRLRGTDSGALARRLSRGFGGLGPDALLRALRHRPSAALLVVLHRRLRGFAARTARRLEARSSWGDQVAATADVLGAHHGIHTHWLLPVRVDDVDAALAGLRAAGIDASGPSNVVDLDPRAQLMNRLVFVPAYPELSRGARRRLLGTLPARAKEPTSC